MILMVSHMLKVDARTFRFVNVTILVILRALTATGLYSLMLPQPPWLYDAHHILSRSLLMLVPFKAAISWRSLKRGFGQLAQRVIAIATVLPDTIEQLYKIRT